MSDGRKAWAEEQEELAASAHLDRLAKITPDQLVEMHDQLTSALRRFPENVALTRGQHNAIDTIRSVRDKLR